ncbi:MAG: molybdopterin-dependent oxidoreductase, partial [Acetobacteraceae bacterium]
KCRTPPERLAAIAGDQTDLETMAAAMDLFARLGCENLDCRQDGARLDASRRDFYLFNATIAGIDVADAILLVGTNPRWEAAVLNARIRRRWLSGACEIALIGEARDLTYRYHHLGIGPTAMHALLGGSGGFAATLRAASRPMIVVGQGALARPDGAAVLAASWTLARHVGALRPDWHGFNVLHCAAARVGGLDLGFLPGPAGRDLQAILDGARTGEVETVLSLGADELDPGDLGAAFLIHIGTHGGPMAARADVLLPGSAFTEKDGTYVNTEGRVQVAPRAVFPPGDAREDWAILRALSEAVGSPLPYDTIDEVRRRLARVQRLASPLGVGCDDPAGPSGDPAAMSDRPFVSPITDFFRTDPIGRASPTMAACAALAATAPAMAAE